MTATAVRPKFAIVHIEMTVTAFVGRSSVLIVNVAFPTIDLRVGAVESIVSLRVVIKIAEWRPLFCRVAVITFFTELALMEVVMAVATGRIDGPEMTLCMTTRTRHSLMLTRQFESA